MTELDRAVAAIERAGSLALACHVQPDGDALGSLLAMHLLCQANGVASVASWGEPFEVAPHYEFLPGLELTTKPSDFPPVPEVMVTFDAGTLDRLGELGACARAAGELIVLDHHPDNRRFGSINVVLPAASTASVVREVARRLGWPLTRDIALCLFTGLVTDTGRFQYENTTPEVFGLAEELAAFDLPIARVNRELYEKHRFAYLKLMAEAVERAELDEGRAFVSTWVSASDLERWGVTFDETEGLIDILRRAGEAHVVCVAKELPRGTKVSLRSLPDGHGHAVDVGAIATRFGGGGHHFSAGFISTEGVHESIEAVRALVPFAVG
jgi:bifunctional oligoribonuclease and PAP phosphatase NrnA